MELFPRAISPSCSHLLMDRCFQPSFFSNTWNLHRTPHFYLDKMAPAHAENNDPRTNVQIFPCHKHSKIVRHMIVYVICIHASSFLVGVLQPGHLCVCRNCSTCIDECSSEATTISDAPFAICLGTTDVVFCGWLADLSEVLRPCSSR
jgi:ferredoxin